MQAVKEKVSNMASKAKEKMTICRARVEERAEVAAARTKEERVMAHERRKAKEAQAKVELHQEKARHASKKLSSKPKLAHHHHHHHHNLPHTHGHGIMTTAGTAGMPAPHNLAGGHASAQAYPPAGGYPVGYNQYVV